MNCNKYSNLSRRKVIQGIAAALGASAFSANAQSSSGDIVIGQSAVQSGLSAALGTEMRQGIEAAFLHANANGGINGRRLALISMDDGYEPDRAVTNSIELIVKKKCMALLGYVGTPTTLGCISLLSTAKIPLVGPFTGANSLRKPINPYVFNVRASYDDEGPQLVNHLVSKGKENRIGVVYQDDAYGRAVLSSIDQAMFKLGIKSVATGTIQRNTLDVREAAQEMFKAGVTGVAIGSTYAASALLAREIRTLGLQPKFASVSFVGTSGLMKQFPNDAKGIGITQVMPNPFTSNLPVVKEYQAAMSKLPDRPFSYGSIEGYIAAQVLMEGLRLCGKDVTRANLQASMEDLQFNLGGFEVAFSTASHQGSKFVQMTSIGQDGQLT